MLRKLIFLALLAAATGCATITRGTDEVMVISTNPAGALATLSSGELCNTPCTLKKKRKDAFRIKIEKRGYESVVVDVISQTSNAGAMGMAGNAVAGGLIGVAVDSGSGAMRSLTPNPVNVTLIPRSVVREEKSKEQKEELLDDGGI